MRSAQLLLARLDAPTAREKYGALQELGALAEAAPLRVYECFDEIAALRRHKNHILGWWASRMLAQLARVDSEGRLDEFLEEYLAPLTGPNMISAANVIRGLPAVAHAKPHLASRLVDAMLQVREARYQTEECWNVAMGHCCEALAAFPRPVPHLAAVREFLREAAANRRPATRRKAARALKLLNA
jgi:hypothetical protein